MNLRLDTAFDVSSGMFLRVLSANVSCLLLSRLALTSMSVLIRFMALHAFPGLRWPWFDTGK